MHPLDSARLKARRAKLHLDALERSVDVFVKSHPYSVTKNDSGQYLEYFIKRKRELPKSWALLVGDFAHNLRSALDHIAYQFNIRTQKPVSDNTCQFPIFDKRSGYWSRGRDQFPKKPRGVKRLLDNLQPYHRRNHPELKLLSVLRDLDNADKHRVITPVFDQAEFELSDRLEDISLLGGDVVFDIDRRGYRVVIPSRVREHFSSQLDPQLTPQVVFDVTERGTKMIYRVDMPTLHNVYVLVHDYIIPSFIPFFVRTKKGRFDEWRTCLPKH